MKRWLFFGRRRGIISEALPWIVISLIILGILMISIFVLRGRGITVIDAIKDLFRAG